MPVVLFCAARASSVSRFAVAFSCSVRCACSAERCCSIKRTRFCISSSSVRTGARALIMLVVCSALAVAMPSSRFAASSSCWESLPCCSARCRSIESTRSCICSSCWRMGVRISKTSEFCFALDSILESWTSSCCARACAAAAWVWNWMSPAALCSASSRRRVSSSACVRDDAASCRRVMSSLLSVSVVTVLRDAAKK